MTKKKNQTPEERIKELEQYLQYYEDMEDRFTDFLCEATGDRMSKSNYELHAMLTELNKYQEELHYGIVKDDILMIIEKGCGIDEIKEYLNKLTQE